MSESVIRRRLIIHGRVQGVFFRDCTRAQATAAGVAGSARNRDDGTVEVVLEGPPEAVERVIAFCRRGPDRARVRNVEVSSEQPQGLASFETR
ncbi:MAG TPA: acylphosphatase [Solirubrobacteraceae bacterium]